MSEIMVFNCLDLVFAGGLNNTRNGKVFLKRKFDLDYGIASKIFRSLKKGDFTINVSNGSKGVQVFGL